MKTTLTVLTSPWEALMPRATIKIASLAPLSGSQSTIGMQGTQRHPTGPARGSAAVQQAETHPSVCSVG